jgi:YHS domain-containing protein
MALKHYQGFVFVALPIALGLVAGFKSPALAHPGSQVPAVNAKDGVGLKGYDPVAYFLSDQSTKGLEQYNTIWKGVTYWFASTENLSRFKVDPDRYLPRYGGYCAYAMAHDQIADIDPSRWAIVNGKLYLNNGYLAQSLWSLDKSGNIQSADRNWPGCPKQPEAK